MSAESDIRNRLRAIVGVDQVAMSILGKVFSVDETEMTCVVFPIAEGAPYLDVRLMADPDNLTTSLYFKPKVDSIVMITPQDECTYFVSMYSEVEEIWLRGTTNGGIPITENIVTKLNNLENKVNTIISTFNSHVHTGVTTGAGSSAVSPTPVSGTLTPTTDDDIQSTTVKHG